MPENQKEEQDMGKMRALTNEEIVEFLSGPIIARLGTVKPDGSPYITPVWQEYDGEAIYFVPRAKARFMKFIQNDPRICLHCAIDVIPFTRVLFEGKAEIIAGPAALEGELLELGRRLARRYLGEHGPTYLEDSKDRPRYLVKLVPERITSWDGVEWHPKYLDENDK